MNNRLIIVGAGGHGKAIADNAVKNGYACVGFTDDHASGRCMGFDVLGTTADLYTLDDGHTDFVIGIGSNAVRRRIAEQYRVNWTTLIHPSAQIAMHVSIGAGTVVMAGAIVNACASIGRHCIINTAAVVEHDNVIEDYAHISPGAMLGGTVHIGEQTHVGIGAIVKNNVSICGGCMIGAGALVLRDITGSGVYFGVPANGPMDMRKPVQR